jgi:hypothetical protein
MQNIHFDFAVNFFANESIIHIWDTVLFHSLEAYRLVRSLPSVQKS